MGGGGAEPEEHEQPEEGVPARGGPLEQLEAEVAALETELKNWSEYLDDDLGQLETEREPGHDSWGCGLDSGREARQECSCAMGQTRGACSPWSIAARTIATHVGTWDAQAGIDETAAGIAHAGKSTRVWQNC